MTNVAAKHLQSLCYSSFHCIWHFPVYLVWCFCRTETDAAEELQAWGFFVMMTIGSELCCSFHLFAFLCRCHFSSYTFNQSILIPNALYVDVVDQHSITSFFIIMVISLVIMHTYADVCPAEKDMEYLYGSWRLDTCTMVMKSQQENRLYNK